MESENRPQPGAVIDTMTLWNLYVLTREDRVRNKLMVHYLPVVKAIARNLANRTPVDVEHDDLVQAGVLGLRDAIASFEPNRCIKFETYCTQRVRGSILDYLRSLDWAPRMLRKRMDRLREATIQYEMSHGTAASDAELCSAMDISGEELASTQKEMLSSILHRVRFSTEDSDDGASPLDCVADAKAEDPFKKLLRQDLREVLHRGLSETERKLVVLYYYENLSFREIGEVLNLCESRVSQLHQVIIERLRERKARLVEASVD